MDAQSVLFACIAVSFAAALGTFLAAEAIRFRNYSRRKILREKVDEWDRCHRRFALWRRDNPYADIFDKEPQMLLQRAYGAMIDYRLLCEEFREPFNCWEADSIYRDFIGDGRP